MRPSSSAQVLDLQSFARALCRELDVPIPQPIFEDLGLFDALGLDSLGAFQMLVTLESLAGVDFPPDDPPTMFTLGDAHHYYLGLCALGAS